MSNYHNADASDADQAGFDTSPPPWMRTTRDQIVVDNPDPMDEVQEEATEIACGCAFWIKTLIPRQASNVYAVHLKDGCSAFKSDNPHPIVFWHQSFTRLGVNLVGWAAIAFITYFLVTRW